MGFEGWLSIIALIMALVSIGWTIFAHRYLTEHASFHANMTAIVELYSRVRETPSILRFHGVTEEELDTAGVTAQEFSYLLASFEVASVYYRFHETSPTPFEASSLRYRLLANPATRQAWPLLSRFFEVDTLYRRRIEATLRLFEAPKRGADLD